MSSSLTISSVKQHTPVADSDSSKILTTRWYNKIISQVKKAVNTQNLDALDHAYNTFVRGPHVDVLQPPPEYNDLDAALHLQFTLARQQIEEALDRSYTNS